jgi:hypothetical protein
VKKRTPDGKETPVSFQTARPDGGGNGFSYRSEGTAWARSNFSHGSKHAIPVGGGKFELRMSDRGKDFIRQTFYADSQASRNAIVNSKLPPLLNPANGKEFFSEGSAAAEFGKGYKKDPGTGRALVPVADASPDHDPPIAQHWTSLGGNDTTQASRQSWNANPGTYKIMSLALNLSLSSRGATYTDTVGINFRGPGE